jgi:hypothetical protein
MVIALPEFADRIRVASLAVAWAGDAAFLVFNDHAGDGELAVLRRVYEESITSILKEGSVKNNGEI